MQQLGLMHGRAEPMFLPPHVILALEPDVVVWQRQAEESQIDIMRQYREALPHAFFVYEIDDALSAVPEKSWHRPFMPLDIDARTEKAVALCDAVTVTTEPLRQHMLSICEPGTAVRVVPNMLAREDVQLADGMRRKTLAEPQLRKDDKLRIGWGGGIGHHGDLALLNDVFAELRDEVTWVFLGMQPDVPLGTSVEFCGATGPQQYLQALASIEVDLVVAPLEENLFNRCKSNLRLVEAGACCYPVIASPVDPYKTNTPPLVGYADSPEEWVSLIREFISWDKARREFAGERMRRWVETNYVLEDHAEERLCGWLPDGVAPFVAQKAKPNSASKLIIVGSGLDDSLASVGRIVPSLPEALALFSGSRNSDILVVRPGVTLTAEKVRTLWKSTRRDEVASVSVMTNDGGITGFPRREFVTVDDTVVASLDKLCAADANEIQIAIASGPVLLIRAPALRALGYPAIEHGEYPEFAVLEWSAMAGSRGFQNVVNTEVFVAVQQTHTFTAEMSQLYAARIGMRWAQGQTDEIALGAFRERLELQFHRDGYRFIPPQEHGDYATWVRYVDTLGPRGRELIPVISSADVAVCRYGEVLSGNSEWILFTQKDAKLEDHAAAVFLDAVKGLDSVFAYADHDYALPKMGRAAHDFKPDFDHHMLFARDYVSQVVMVRRSFLEIPDGSEVSEVDIYRAAHAAARRDRGSLVHVPRVLAHLRPPTAPEAFVALADRKLVVAQEAARAIGWPVRIDRHGVGPILMDVSYAASPDAPQPKVSIIVPTKDNLDMLGPCLATLLSMTDYQNFEVLIVSNNTTNPEMKRYLREGLLDARVRVVEWNEPYNWSTLNNWAVARTDGEFLCLLNDDTRVVSRSWLSEMVGAAKIPGVGTVGARLTYPNGLIQHVGVCCSNGVTGHYHKGMPTQYVGYNGIACISHEATVVTGACMLVSRELFDLVGGLDEEFAHNFNDVAFGWEMRRRGLVNVVATHAELQHYEGVTRVSPMTSEGRTLQITEGLLLRDKYPDVDPYWNNNLSIMLVQDRTLVVGTNFDVLNWSPEPLSWVKELKKSAVLLIGPSGSIDEERGDRVSIYEMAFHDGAGVITSPPMENVRAFPIERPDVAATAMRHLDIERVIVTAIGKLHPSVLAFVARLGVPVIYRPTDAESVCPRHDLTDGSRYCGGGWRDMETCQACIDRNGSPHGYVSVMAWRAEWLRFLASANVEIDIRPMLLGPEKLLAVTDTYGMSDEEQEAVA
jgi:GT2 family glycosyltransferase/glycosyltransferase involved in cell wall biosynthesis